MQVRRHKNEINNYLTQKRYKYYALAKYNARKGHASDLYKFSIIKNETNKYKRLI